MNFELIGNLVRLRYRLLWAHTRTRNGKIALFFAGYLLFVMVIALFAAGGVGVGMQAVRQGHGTTIAGALLTGVFVQALLASAVLGFGMTVIFSEGELRRYPLTALERRVTRHFIGILDLFWIFFFVFDVAIAFGLYLMGAGSLGYCALAVLLLFLCNYAAARVLAMIMQHVSGNKYGSMMMLGGVILLGLLPSLLAPVLQKHKELRDAVLQIWRVTPPAAAGVAMTHSGMAGLQSLGTIILWTAALVILLIAMERWPRKSAAAQKTTMVFEDRIDRMAAIYGPKNGPLVAHWLRFYWRNNRFRTIYPLALPLACFMMFYFTRQAKLGGAFPVALSVFGLIGFVGTGQFAVNQFGYVGGGFRRFLLLPTDPAAAFRAGNYMFVSLSAILIPPAVVLWCFFGPIPSTLPMVVMLAGSSVTILFLFHGACLWTSVLGARRGKFNQTFGNDLSFAGNVLVIGGMLLLLFGPRVFDQFHPGWITPDYWYVTPLLAVLALIFYIASLRFTSSLFGARREQLMALMEGKG